MRIYLSLFTGALLLLLALSAGAAPSWIGPSGLIFTPDDTVVYRTGFNAFYHAVFDDVGFGGVGSYWGANIGLLRDVEVGFTGVTDVADDGTDILANGKWNVTPETENRPGVAVGVIDAFNQLDVSGTTVYFAVGKNFGPYLQRWFGVCPALRLNAGVGTGLFKHGFIGGNWAFSNRLQLMAEYSGTEFPSSSDTGGNLGLRYAVTPEIRIDAGLLDFQNFGIGFSYNSNMRVFQ